MLNRDERLRYLAKLEAARSVLLTDPEIAAEYAQAQHAWDSSIRPAIVDDQPEPPSSNGRPAGRRRS